jgi:phage host-nuclease inhibitor protein Gam
LELRNEERIAPLRRNLEWLHERFDKTLEIYAQAKTAGAKTRTVKLLYATLSFRKSPDTLNVVDEAAAIEWARANAPQAVKLSILKTPLKAYVQALGDVPPGCSWEIGADVFRIATEETKG